MKYTFRKALCLFLSILLVFPTVAGTLVFAEGIDSPSAIAVEHEGQKNLPVLMIDNLMVADGIVSDMEYGYNEPLLHLTSKDGFWAEDMSGNAFTGTLPNYIDLYLARNDDALFVAIKVNEKNVHTDNKYVVNTFLGFGDTTTAGAETEFTTVNVDHGSVNGKFAETAVTSLKAAPGERLYSIDTAYEYPLPTWAAIKEESNGSYSYTFEAELNLEDAVQASGKSYSEIPGAGYFSFDFALYDGSTQVGVLHFNANDAIPHVLNLAGGDSSLASLSVNKASAYSQPFSPEVLLYTATVPFGTAIEVTAIPTDANANVTISGADTLGVNGEGNVSITVTPQNGAPSRTYTLSIRREISATQFTATEDTFQEVLESIALTSWNSGSAALIKLSGEITSDTDVLFNFPTVFTKTGAKLPIIIEGNSTTVINIANSKVAAANDYTFRGVTMPIATKNINFFAGAGNVTFENVDFRADNTPKAHFFGDNFTEAVYFGWTDKNFAANRLNGGYLPSSITFKGSSIDYSVPESQGVLLAAVGFNGSEYEQAENVQLELKPTNSYASFIIDGAFATAIAARVGTAPVAQATAQINSGSVSKLYGNDTKVNANNMPTYTGDIKLVVTGGSVDTIRSLYIGILKGNATIDISEANSVMAPTVIQTVTAATLAEIKGNSTLNISGGTFKGDVAGSTANLTTINNISGGTFETSFFGLGAGGTRKVVNTITGGNFTGSKDSNYGFFGGHATAGYIRGIVNNFIGGSVSGFLIGGNYSGTVYGDIINNYSGTNIGYTYHGGNHSGTVAGKIINNFNEGKITKTTRCGSFGGTVSGNIINNFNGTTFTLGIYGGNRAGTVSGKVINNFNEGSFSGAIYGGGDSATIREIENNFYGGTYTGSVRGGAVKATVSGNITNNLYGGSFATFYGISAQGAVSGNVKNNVSGNVTIDTFYGGSYTTETAANVSGSVTNKIKLDENGAAPTFTTLFIGGSVGGTIGSGITNNIEAGTFATFYGGSNDGTIDVNADGNSVSNNITGGTFTTFYGGSKNGTLLGCIANVVSGGSFTNYYGGNEQGSVATNDDGVSVTNTVSAGTFTFYNGGSKNGTVESIVNNITGGKFTDTAGGANAQGTVNGTVTNNLSGTATFTGFFGGSRFEETETETAATIKGLITNNVKADANEVAPTFKNRSGLGTDYFGGSRAGVIESGIVNNIEAGSFLSRSYGGSYVGTVGIDANTSYSIVNNVSGGTFSDDSTEYWSAGNLSAALEGPVHTAISGGTFVGQMAGGSRAVTGGRYETIITGGTFEGNVYAANRGHNDSQANNNSTVSATLTIKGGVFNGTVYGGGNFAHPVTESSSVTINEGVFNANVYPGSASKYDNVGTVTIDTTTKAAQGLLFNGNVMKRSDSEKIHLVIHRSGYTIYLGPQGYLQLDEFSNTDSDYQVIFPTETLVDGHTYIKITVPNISIKDDPETEENESYTLNYSSKVVLYGDSATFVKSKGEDGLYTWVGKATRTLTQDVSAYPEVLNTSYTITGTNVYSGATRSTYVGKKLENSDVLTLTNATVGEYTSDEYRQMAVDYFQLQASFSWTPNENFIERTSNYKKYIYDESGKKVGSDKVGIDKLINQGEVYGGIPYQSVSNGNLYRWLEYYDEETGIFYVTDAVNQNGGVSADHAKNPGAKYFFNQCSVASYWGWARLINSARFTWTSGMTVYNGFIPVGLYEYPTMYTQHNFGAANSTNEDAGGEDDSGGESDDSDESDSSSTDTLAFYDTTDVINLMTGMTRNQRRYKYKSEWSWSNFGYVEVRDSSATADEIKTYVEDKYLTQLSEIYRCYALMQPGDLVVSTGHAMMIHSVNLVYDSNGNIDYTKSTASVVEQIEGWASGNPSSYNLYTYTTGAFRESDISRYAATTSNGYNYTRQGRVGSDKAYSFFELQESNYLPFTFAEYHYDDAKADPDGLSAQYIAFYNSILEHRGEAPLASAVSQIAVKDGEEGFINGSGALTQEQIFDMFSADVDEEILLVSSKVASGKGYSVTDYKNTLKNATTLSYTQYKRLVITSNYAISDVFVTLTDDKGTEDTSDDLIMFKKIFRAPMAGRHQLHIGNSDQKNVYGASGNMYVYLNDLAGKNFKIEIAVQLSNGQYRVLTPEGGCTFTS